jgi:hypothetical protein
VPVLTAAKLMDAGAAVSTGTLIISLALISAIKAALRTATWASPRPRSAT